MCANILQWKKQFPPLNTELKAAFIFHYKRNPKIIKNYV